MAKVIKVLKKFSEKNAGNTDLLCWNFLKLNSYSRSHFYRHLIVNFHVKIFFRYFHSNPEIPQVNVILGVQISAHISVQIRYKVLLLSAGNIQAEIFNRLSRSIRQELTKNAVQKK